MAVGYLSLQSFWANNRKANPNAWFYKMIKIKENAVIEGNTVKIK